MAEEKSRGGGFGWGVVLGGVAGFIAGAYLASGPGREQVDTLRTRTIELTGRGDELRSRARDATSRARSAVNDPDHPIGRAINEGIQAARRRRQELEEGSPTPAASTGSVPDTAGPGSAPLAGGVDAADTDPEAPQK